MYDPLLISKQMPHLSLEGSRPLILTDADEVLVHFVAPLEKFLSKQGLFLDLASFQLAGNIKCRETGYPVDKTDIPDLIGGFFRECVQSCPPVNGAAGALEKLSQRAQIIILSNVPAEQKAKRQTSLAGHGMDYPLIANRGPKGLAVQAITNYHEAPVFFIDDLPENISSVAEHAPDVHRIHFVADARLAGLVEPASGAHMRIDNWEKAADYIAAQLTEFGY